VAATAIIVVAALIGVFLAVKLNRAQACTRWHDALAEQAARASASVGAGTAAQFRLEAIRRGWVDNGGNRVFRPSGCTP
jgi:hypothetical protein